MKRIIVLSALLVSLCPSVAQAGGSAEKIGSTALKETEIRNALWLGSSSAAGLAFRPYNIFNTLDLRYNGAYGEYRGLGEGKSSTEVSLNTEGAAYLGKFLVTGDFSFKNTFDQDALYNVLLYQLEDNMPYYPMDDRSSGWKRQAYELGAGLASPVLWDRVAFGIDLEYFTKVGAKQLDPRGETYKYGIQLRPSVTVSLGKNLLGLSALYADGFERSKPSNNYNWDSQKIWYNRGLGESTQSKVGGNDGMKTCFWRTTKFGGALQYSWSDAVFAEVGYTYKQTDVKENPELPKRLGSAKEQTFSLDAAWLFGRDKSDKLSLDADFALTDGIEYIQKLNTAAFQQEWMVISTNAMSSYTDIRAALRYDHLFGAADPRGYDWKVGAEASFRMFDQSYLAPASTSNAMRAYAGINADKQFKFKRSALLLGLDGGYAAGFGSGYTCLSTKAYATPKAAMADQADWLNASFIKAGARVDWTFEGSKRANWVFGAKANWLKPTSLDKDRLAITATFGIIF